MENQRESCAIYGAWLATKDRLWHVTFDDGDEEELDLEKLLFALDSYDIVKRAEKKDEKETDEQSTVKSAPPPLHTVIVFAIVMSMCMYMLPSLQSIDEYATIETFQVQSLRKDHLHYLRLHWQ